MQYYFAVAFRRTIPWAEVHAHGQWDTSWADGPAVQTQLLAAKMCCAGWGDYGRDDESDFTKKG